MKLRTKFPLTIAAILTAGLLVAGPVSPASAKAAPGYSAYGSCGNSKPFKPAKRCRYDSGMKFRGTFVFRSKVGKVRVKACFRAYGRAPVGGGHACQKIGPLEYKAYPFKIAGVRQPFGVKFTWYAKKSGAGKFEKVASSYLKVRP